MNYAFKLNQIPEERKLLIFLGVKYFIQTGGSFNNTLASNYNMRKLGIERCGKQDGSVQLGHLSQTPFYQITQNLSKIKIFF